MTDRLGEAYERVKALQGHTSRHRLGPLDPLAAARFTIAVGTPRELVDENGLPGGRIPYLYPSSMMAWDAGLPEEQLRLDGTGGDVLSVLPLEGLRLMGVGQELEFNEPLRAGTEVVLEISVDEVELKQGRSGGFLLITLLRRFVAAEDGRELISCRERFVGKEGA